MNDIGSWKDALTLIWRQHLISLRINWAEPCVRCVYYIPIGQCYYSFPFSTLFIFYSHATYAFIHIICHNNCYFWAACFEVRCAMSDAIAAFPSDNSATSTLLWPSGQYCWRSGQHLNCKRISTSQEDLQRRNLNRHGALPLPHAATSVA